MSPSDRLPQLRGFASQIVFRFGPLFLHNVNRSFPLHCPGQRAVYLQIRKADHSYQHHGGAPSLCQGRLRRAVPLLGSPGAVERNNHSLIHRRPAASAHIGQIVYSDATAAVSATGSSIYELCSWTGSVLVPRTRRFNASTITEKPIAK